MKYYNITKLENSEKNKKNRERTDVYGCTGIGGGIPATHCNARLIRC